MVVCISYQNKQFNKTKLHICRKVNYKNLSMENYYTICFVEERGKCENRAKCGAPLNEKRSFETIFLKC